VAPGPVGLGLLVFTDPHRKERRPYLYAIFIWCYTSLWLIALVFTWSHYDRWPLWVRVAATICLIVATPAASDLFLLVRRRRTGK
jgi:hypothetical protein